MEFDDPVYGRQEVGEEVLRELIRSGPVQRLKHIHQRGPMPFFSDRAPTKRFEHSVGTMILLQRFDASIEEQIAGLLHDASHTAFSHAADFIFPNQEYEYHDSFLEEIVMGSEIPGILEEHGFNVNQVLEPSSFKLLERDLPDLCADRIDYFLRDRLGAGILSEEEIAQFLDSLIVKEGGFVLEDVDTAEEYALKYIECDRELPASPEEAAVYKLFASILKRAMEIGVLDEEDLFGTDEDVMQVLRRSDDPEIQGKLETLEGGFKVERNRENYDFRAETKARFVDPRVAEEDMKRISKLSGKVRQRIEEHREDVENGYCIKVLD